MPHALLLAFPILPEEKCQVWTYFLCHLAEFFITGTIASLPYHPGIPSSSLLFAKFPYLLTSSNDTILFQFAYESDTKICLLAFGKKWLTCEALWSLSIQNPWLSSWCSVPFHPSASFSTCFLTCPKLCSWTNDKSNHWNNHRSISHLSSAVLYHLLSSLGSINVAPVGHYHLWLGSLSWFEKTVSTKEGRSLLEMENVNPLLPLNYYNFWN